jgi:chorismate mutase
MLHAVRGATTLSANTAEAMMQAVDELLTTLMQRNQLQPSQLLSVFFTTTADITACSAAKAARLTQAGWHNVPLFCALEPPIEGLPALCVRVLLHVQGLADGHPTLNPCYLHEAATLRPDVLG